MSYRQPFKGESPITQYYGEKYTNLNGHTGIDYATPIGTEILASNDGIVVSAGWDSTGFGNMVILQHNDGKATLYAHLSCTKVYLKQKVSQGDVIGLSGYSGNVVPEGPAGAHLHFEARAKWNDYKSHRDPVTFLPLMSVDDSIYTEREKNHPILPAGVCQVLCPYAFIRTWNSLERDRILKKGELVYIFPDVKFNESGLPFRFIGAGRCIAEYDVDGTQIIGVYHGSEEEDFG